MPAVIKKLAVVFNGLGVGGSSFFPRAMLTIAVMCVSGPYTLMGTPSVLPVHKKWRFSIVKIIKSWNNLVSF